VAVTRVYESTILEEEVAQAQSPPSTAGPAQNPPTHERAADQGRWLGAKALMTRVKRFSARAPKKRRATLKMTKGFRGDGQPAIIARPREALLKGPTQ